MSDLSVVDEQRAQFSPSTLGDVLYPLLRRDDAGLARKYFGQQQIVYVRGHVGTAIGQHGEPVVLSAASRNIFCVRFQATRPFSYVLTTA